MATVNSVDLDLGARPGARARGMLLRLTRVVARWAVGLSVALVAWTLLLEITGTEPYNAASPAVAWEELVADWPMVLDAIRVTALEASAGLLASVTIACALAVLFVVSRPAEKALLPYALAFRSVPVVAVAPLLVLIVGRGLPTAVVCVTIVTFFPVLVNLSRGLRAASPELLELFRVHGANQGQVMLMVRAPTAIPHLFVGLRVAAAKGVLGALLAEWLTGSQGLGYLLVYASGRRQIGLLWATMAIATIGAIVVFRATLWAERAVQRRLPVGAEPA